MWKCTNKRQQEAWVHVTLTWVPQGDSEIRDGKVEFTVDAKHDRYEVGEEFDYYPMVKPHKHVEADDEPTPVVVDADVETKETKHGRHRR